MSVEDPFEELRKQKDMAYGERNKLVAVLSKIFPAWISRHDDNDKSWEDDWRWIVFVLVPTRVVMQQVSWHIHDSELPEFEHLDVRPNIWDGHSTDEKYKRLEEITVTKVMTTSDKVHVFIPGIMML